MYETFNPDAKWDWYQIGGRWQGSLILKQGKTGFKGTPSLLTEPSEHYDGAYVRDIDFERMREWKRKTLTPYKEIQKDPFWTEERIDATYRNEDEYIRRCTTFHTYAVVTPDGEWHAVGEMGWFGFSSESPAIRRKWEQEYRKRYVTLQGFGRPKSEMHLKKCCKNAVIRILSTPMSGGMSWSNPSQFIGVITLSSP